MNYSQARQMADAFRTIGGFSKIEVDHFGFWSQHSPALDDDGKWSVHLWSINSRAGNTNLTMVSVYSDDPAEIARLARKARGKATARDKRAFARQEAEREMDRE